MSSEITALFVDTREDTRMCKVLLDVGEGAVVTTGGMYSGLRIILVALPGKGEEGDPKSLGILYLDEKAEKAFREALDAR